MPQNKILMVEVDIFHPKGKSITDWEFIKTMRLTINTNDIQAGSEEAGVQIQKAIESWESDK